MINNNGKLIVQKLVKIFFDSSGDESNGLNHFFPDYALRMKDRKLTQK